MPESMTVKRMDKLRKKKIWNDWHKDEVLSEITRLKVENKKLTTEAFKELGIKERIMSERDVAYDKIKKIEAEKVDLFDIGIREKKRAIKAENNITKLEAELQKYRLKDYEERHEKAVKGS
jgi:hypothetical protein